MGIFRTKERVDLRTPLELVRDASGRTQGALEGAPVSLIALDQLRVPLSATWPGAVVTLQEPEAMRGGALGSKQLRNRSRRSGWMVRVFEEEEVRALVEALTTAPFQVDVEDGALVATVEGEPSGPEIRRGVRAVVRLAQALPAAMFRVVDSEVRKQAEVRAQSAATKALLERAKRREGEDQGRTASDDPGSCIPPSQQPDVLALRLQRSRRLLFSSWGIAFGGMVLAFGLRQADGELNFGVFVGTGVVLTVLALLLYGNECPRCEKSLFRWWSSPLLELVGDFQCRHCGLRPSSK